MKIGSAYQIKKIEPRHWQACAKQLRLSTVALIERLHDMTKRLETLAPLRITYANRPLTPDRANTLRLDQPTSQ